MTPGVALNPVLVDGRGRLLVDDREGSDLLVVVLSEVGVSDDVVVGVVLVVVVVVDVVVVVVGVRVVDVVVVNIESTPRFGSTDSFAVWTTANTRTMTATTPSTPAAPMAAGV